ncbi:MAG: hypothetical protein AAGD38_11080 [Acidobacteriota bacterium]
MRRIAFVLLLFTFLTVPAIGDEVEVRRLEQSFSLGDADDVDIDITVGDITVEGTDDRDVTVDARLYCDDSNLERCRKQAQELRLVPRIGGSTFYVDLRRTPWSRLRGVRSELIVRVPRHLEIEIDIRAGGSATISGMKGEIEVDGGAADVSITYPRAEVGKVKLSSAVGQSNLIVDGSTIEGTGIPRNLTWNGPGRHTVEVDVGSGDVTVTLE